MKDMSKVENKRDPAQTQRLNPLEKKVKIQFKPGRAMMGVGKAGEEVEVYPNVAERLVSMGYADYVKEEVHDDTTV